MRAAHATRCRQLSRHAFTLVELLVVLVASALLVGQVASAAGKARDDARVVLCRQRLGEIARAATAYAAADPKENGIPIGVGDAWYSHTYDHYAYYGFGGKSGRGTTTDPTLRTSIWSGAFRLNAYNRPLNHVLYKDPLPNLPIFTPDWGPDARLKLDVFHCPGDQGFAGMHHNGWASVSDRSSYDYYGTSYVANPLFVGLLGSSDVYTISPYGRALSHTPNPANTIFYWENAARFAPVAPNTDDYDQTGCFWGTGGYRDAAQQNMVAHGNHGQDWHFSAAFADGHVDFLEIRGHGRVYGLRDELIVNGVCSPFGPNDSTTCDCILARGLGWQLDTLPDSPLLTSKSGGGGLGVIWGEGGSSEFTFVR